MSDINRSARSLAVETLQSPKYLASVERRIALGLAPELDLLRTWRDRGLSAAAQRGIRWHAGLKMWVGQVYRNDILVYRGQHRLLRDAMDALEAAIDEVKGA